MASLNIGFGTDDGPAGYPLNSAYDTFEWVKRFGDPNAEYMQGLAQILGLIMLELCDTPILPLNLIDYANHLSFHFDQFIKFADEKRASLSPKNNIRGEPDTQLDFNPMKDSIQKLHDDSNTFHVFNMYWNDYVVSNGVEDATLQQKRFDHNDKMIKFETHMLDMSGVPGRKWFKNTIFGPKLSDPQEAQYFPALYEAVENGDWDQVRYQLDRTSSIISGAAAFLN